MIEATESPRSDPAALSIDALPRSSGVYLLTHRVTGDTYVGRSVNLHSRSKAHVSSLRRGMHEKPALRDICEKHGVDIDFKVLCVDVPLNELAQREREMIEKFSPTLNIVNPSGCAARKKRISSDRVFVRIPPEWKKRLDILAAVKQVRSNETYAGDLLMRIIEEEERVTGKFTPAPKPRK